MTVQRGQVFQCPSLARIEFQGLLQVLLRALPVCLVLFLYVLRLGSPVHVETGASYAKTEMRFNGLRIDRRGFLETLCGFLESKGAACLSTLIDP